MAHKLKNGIWAKFSVWLMLYSTFTTSTYAMFTVVLYDSFLRYDLTVIQLSVVLWILEIWPVYSKLKAFSAFKMLNFGQNIKILPLNVNIWMFKDTQIPFQAEKCFIEIPRRAVSKITLTRWRNQIWSFHWDLEF